MIHFLLTFAFTLSQPISEFTEYLSPFDIFWPEDWQSSVVELSSNHAGETVNLILNCHIYQAVPKGAYIEISIQGFENSPFNTTSAFDQPKEGDNRITFKNITLPSKAGSYGPVSVVVRYQGPNSMLLAQSSSLTSIAVLPEIPKADPNLTVSYASGASKVISQTTTLTFSFVINQDLYYNDYFVLDVDPNYGFDVINEGLIWDSNNLDTEYFKNMKVKYEKSANQLIFYNLDTETDDVTYFKVSVTNIINPTSVINEARAGKWNMTIYRFGTPTVKQRVYEPGQVQFPIAGKFASTVWEFAFRTLDLNPLFKTFTCYMVLNITLGHDIPLDGTIEVTYSASVDITKYSHKTTDKQKLQTGESYVTSLPNNQLSCEIKSSTKVLCKALKGIPKGDVVSIYNLVYFEGDSPGVDSVESKDNKGFVLDKLENPIILSYNSNPVYLKVKQEDSQVYIVNVADLTEIKTSGTKGDLGIALSFRIDNALNSLEGSVFLSISSVISSQYSVSSFSFSTSVSSFLSSDYSSFSPSSYKNQIQTVFTPNKMVLNTIIDITGTNYINILIKSSSSVLSTPLYPSTQGVMYEFDFYYRSLEKYYFDRKIMFIEVKNHENSLKTFCKIKETAGLPVLATVIPSFTWNWNSNYQVFIDFFISSNTWKFEDWSLNGEIQGSYPSNNSLNNPLVLSGSNKSGSGSEVHLVYDLLLSTLLSTGNIISVIFPVPALLSISSIDLTSSIIVRDKTENFNVTISKSVSKTLSFTSSEVTQKDVDVTSENSINNLKTYTFSPSPSFTISHFLIIFSKGFDLTSLSSSSYAKLDTLNHKSSFSVIYSTTINSIAQVKIEKIVDPWMKSSKNSKIIFVDSSFIDSSCSYYDDLEIASSSKTLNISLTTSKEVQALGASSLKGTFTFILTSPGFFEGSSKSFLKLVLDEKVKNSQAWLDDTLFTFSSNEISFPVAKDIKNDDKMNLTIIIDLFDVTTTQEIYLVKEIFFEFDQLKIYKNSNLGLIKFTKGESSGTSKSMSLTVFPNNFNYSNTYFFLSFYTNFSLPVGTNITIIGEHFHDDVNLNLDLWCTLGYINPLVYKGQLSFITLFNHNVSEKISIIKDNAFTIPSNNDNKTPFQVIASFNGFLIIDDRKTSTNYIKYADIPSSKLYMASLNLEISNKGSESWHTFTFKINTDTTDGWSYLFFMSNDYSAHGGVVFSYEELPNVYFLDSYSSLSKISCIVDHWIVICNGLEKIKADNVIDISLKLINPATNMTRWEILAMTTDENSNFLIKTLPIEGITVKLNDIPANYIDILQVDYIQLKDSSTNLSLRTKLNIDLTSDDTLKVLFPRPYTVEIYNPNQIVCRKRCSGTNTSDIEYCTVQGNIVVFPIKDEIECKNRKIEFTIFSIFTPKNGGFLRDESSKIVTDYLEFPYWTEKFNMFVIKNSNPTAYQGSSYPNTNSAYTGFKESASSFIEINENQPIKLTAGTFSQFIKISIKSGVLRASILKFLATDFNDYQLRFSSQGVYALTNDMVTTYFRVGIDENSFDGFYYITWTIQETMIYLGLEQYQAPSKTQVQVFSVYKLNITVPSHITMNTNSRSVIEIDFNGISPYQDIYMNLTVNSDCKITLEEKTIKIDSNSTKVYALINSFSSEGTCTISYSVSNAKVFNKPLDTEVTVKQTNSSAIKADLTFKIISQNTAQVLIKPNQAAFVYWAFLSTILYEANETLSIQEYIKNNSQPLFEASNQEFSLARQVLYYEISLGTAISDYWGETCRKMLILADQISFYGLNYVKPSENAEVLVYFNNLIANTSYTIVVYVEPVDNSVDQSVLKLNETASTKYYGSSTLIVVKLEDDQSDDMVYSAVALSLNIPKNRIVGHVKSQRRLLVVKELIVVPSVRSDQNTSELAKRLNEKNFIENFNAIAGTNYLTSVTLTIDYDGVDSKGYGIAGYSEWKFIPLDDGLSFNFTLNDQFTVCCIVTEYFVNDENLTSKDIALGYFQNGERFIWKECLTVTKDKIRNITFWEDENKVEDNDYYMTCLPCNLYPMIPHCVFKSSYSYYKEGKGSVSYAEHTRFTSGLLLMLFISCLAYIV